MMRRKRRVTALTLVVFLVTMLLPAYGSTSNDYSSHWSSPAISKVEGYGINIGGSVGRNPEYQVNRADFAEMMNKAFGYDRLSVAHASGFSDLPADSPYARHLSIAVAMGIFEGDGAGSINPEDKITREMVACILAKVLRLPEAPAGFVSKFTDIGEVSSWALWGVHIMELNGYMTGSNNEFMPKRLFSYGETSQLLLNVIGVIIDDDLNAQRAEYKNLTIRKPGVVLKNAIVTGDLFITEGVGDGSVWLDGVSIGGRLLVGGGGERSVHLRDISVGGSVVVDKPAAAGSEPVRLRFVDTDHTTIALEGIIQELIITDDIILIIELGGAVTVFNMREIAGDGDKLNVVIEEGAEVSKLTVFVPAELKGDGTVGKLEAHTGGIAVDESVKVSGDIEAPAGVEVSVGGETVVGSGLSDPTEKPAAETFPEPTPPPAPSPEPSPSPSQPTPTPSPPPSFETGGSGGGSGGGGGAGGGGSSSTQALGGSASISGTSAIGQSLTVNTGSITGGSGAFSFQWRADGASLSEGSSSTYVIKGGDAGKAITCVVTRANATGSVTATFDSGLRVPYGIQLDVSGDTGTDQVSLVNTTGRAGANITINYTLDGSGTTNTLSFNHGIAAVTTAGGGTRSYTVNASHASNGIITITATFSHSSLTREDTPNAGIDYVNEVLTGLTGNHSFNGGAATTDVSIHSNWFGTTIDIVKPGNGVTTTDSLAQELPIPAPPAAPSLGKTDETETGGDGTITGVDSTMEYSANNGASWTGVSGSSVDNLAPGIYHVRVKAVAGSGGNFAGVQAEVTIQGYVAGKNPTPTASINFEAETLTGLADGTYTFNGGSSVSVSGGSVPISWFGTTVAIINVSDGLDPSDPQNLNIKARQSTPTPGVSHCTTSANNNGQITGVANGMVYSGPNGDTTVHPIDGSIVDDLEPGNYDVWWPATTSEFKSDVATVTINSFTATPETTPNFTINYTNETLIANAAGGYTFNGGSTVNLASGDSYEINPSWFGYSVSIVKKGDGSTTTDSDAQSLPIPARLSAPTGLDTTDATTATAEDGKITGVDNTMEYQKSGDGTSWTTISGTSVEGLASGTYYVRYSATSSEFASLYATAEIGVVGVVSETIDIAAILGVTVPSINGVPVTEITATEQYTGTVTWSPNHGTFAADTVYTATITIIPKSGFKLDGVAANFFTVDDATSVTHDADSGVITAVFPSTSKKAASPLEGRYIISTTGEPTTAGTAVLDGKTLKYLNATDEVVGEVTLDDDDAEILAELAKGTGNEANFASDKLTVIVVNNGKIDMSDFDLSLIDVVFAGGELELSGSVLSFTLVGATKVTDENGTIITTIEGITLILGVDGKDDKAGITGTPTAKGDHTFYIWDEDEKLYQVTVTVE